jgi:hypothetical protein
MVASAIALGISGSMIFLLLQGAAEQRRGLASATVEQSANFLQSSIVNCLRGMSANQGLSPNYTSALLDANGHLLGYQTVFVFYANADGSYTTQQISVDARSGRVTYTPDVSKPASTVLWMTNGVNVALRQLCFSTSFNPDGSLNSSLVNVQFNMDDNGATQQGSNNNSTSLFRTFSVRMRSDS